MSKDLYLSSSANFKRSSCEARKLGFWHHVLILFFSIAYASVLSQLPDETFKDFSNYLIQAEFSGLILLNNFGEGWSSIFFNEPIWLVINSLLSFILEPAEVLSVIIFISAVIVAYVILKNNFYNCIWLIVFLLLPNILKNNLVHIRQGLAIAFFLLGWFSSNRNWRYFIILLTPFIHSSFFFVILLIAFVGFLRKLKLSPVTHVCCVIIMGLFITYSLTYISQLLGARQAFEYDFIAPVTSGLGFIFWFIVLILLMTQRKIFRQHLFEISCLVFYLSTYFSLEVTARVFEDSMLLVLVAGLSLISYQLLIYRFFILFYGIFMWVFYAQSLFLISN